MQDHTSISCPRCNTRNKLPSIIVSSVVRCFKCNHGFISRIEPPPHNVPKRTLVGYSRRFRGEAKDSIFMTGLIGK